MRSMVHDTPTWSAARFPSRACREDFLRDIGLWNRVEELLPIDVRLLPDGLSVRYLCRDQRERGLGRLVESYGGSAPGAPPRPAEFDD